MIDGYGSEHSSGVILWRAAKGLLAGLFYFALGATALRILLFFIF